MQNNKMNSENLDALWSSFLEHWPLEKLEEKLSLERYTDVIGDREDSNTFTYWLETKTEALGSIWGGSSFKFGVYQRASSDEKENGRGRIYADKYAWYAKYGKTLETAFENVKVEVIKVALAARHGQFDVVEKADLGPAVKWKIAFLYQDRSHIRVLPIYKLEVLRAIAGRKQEGYTELYRQLLETRGGSPIFEFAANLWRKGQEILASTLKHEEALEYLDTRFSRVKEPVQYMAGFETEAGRQIGLVRRGTKVSAFVEPGHWETKIPGVVLKKYYEKNERRIHSLESNAPKLSVGNPAEHIFIPSMAVLIAFCDAYDATPSEDSNRDNSENEPFSARTSPTHIMNKILYGPPGTGKTFKTARIAVEICDGTLPPEDAVMARYEELRKEGRISFTTFHQSYSYEDFIEGLRPEIKDGQIAYNVRPGLFKEICDAARRSTLVKPGLAGKPLSERTIFKMSLGIAGTTEGKLLYQDCIQKGYVLLGWGEDVDFSGCNTGQEIRRRIEEVRPDLEVPETHARYIGVFKDEVRRGDIIIISQGNLAFRAIGEVLGDYEFLEATPVGGYHQMRRVRWLAVFEGSRPVNDIYERNFMQSSLYKLNSSSVSFTALGNLVRGSASSEGQAFVLIIDEINRANISKVFGELITLLEPDKREGADNALYVKLPYSGQDFSVPTNLHIIGTMNTADRSIALLDTALRRRFEFEELQPDTDAILEVGEEFEVDMAALLSAMNERIEYLYDRDHTIGHAYFMKIKTLADLDFVFRRKVIPLLQEYFYDDWSKVRMVLNDREGRFIDAEQETPLGLDSEKYILEPKTRYKVRKESFQLEAFQKIYK